SIGGGFDRGDFGLQIASNRFSGLGTDQTVGMARLRIGDFSMSYENDGLPFGGWAGDGNDSYRTAAASIGYKDYSLGINLFTGKRTAAEFSQEAKDNYGDNCGLYCVGEFGEVYKNGLVYEKGPRYRMGALYLGYKGYRAGIDSEWVRHGFQNYFAHNFFAKQRMFQMTSDKVKPYFQYQSKNIFTSW
ncbi:MAG TPA: polymorphic toxin type 23 domain-containing protein, partial [Luteibaculaceae bacterium]|nr:polymorphic toxin type 23 domain-containing protein [Luteibaculaceae bacterium]